MQFTSRMSRFVLALAFLAALSSPCVQGQPPSGEWLPGIARIIIADNTVGNSQLVAVDLPSFNVTHRISIPGPVASIGLTADNEFAGVFRGKAGNDQQLLTFVHTGIKPLSGFAAPPSAAASTVPGYLRKLVITKSALVYNGTDTIGGVEGGDSLVYHPRWRTHLLYSEVHGLVLAYNASASANPATALRTSSKASIPPGHFHLIPVNNYLGAPHTSNSLAILLDTAGKIAYSAECGQCHGSIAFESSPTKAVILYGCNTSVLTVTINTSSSRPTFTPRFIPVDIRIGSFVAGAPGVYWTAAQPAVNVTAPQETTGPVFFWRTDVRTANHAITRVNHLGSTLGIAGHVLKVLGLPEKQRMLAVHRAGLLVMYNGVTGAVLGNVTIQAGGFSLDSLAPFLIAHGNQIYISVPSTGKVHDLDANFTTGALTVKRSVNVGGVLGTLVVADQANL